jgi:hypothetical protein
MSQDTIRFFISGKQGTKGSADAFIPKGWTRPVVTNNNKRNKLWQAKICLYGRDYAPAELWTGPVELNITFHM